MEPEQRADHDVPVDDEAESTRDESSRHRPSELVDESTHDGRERNPDDSTKSSESPQPQRPPDEPEFAGSTAVGGGDPSNDLSVESRASESSASLPAPVGDASDATPTDTTADMTLRAFDDFIADVTAEVESRHGGVPLNAVDANQLPETGEEVPAPGVRSSVIELPLPDRIDEAQAWAFVGGAGDQEGAELDGNTNVLPAVVVIVQLADIQSIMQQEREALAAQMAAMLEKIAADKIEEAFWKWRCAELRSGLVIALAARKSPHRP